MGRGKAFAAIPQLASFIRERGYSIVQTHDTTPLIYTSIAKCYYPHFQHIYTEHSGIYSCHSRHRFMTWLALLSTNHAVMVSKNLLSFYQKHFPLTKPEMSVIYNGLDIPAAAASAKESVCKEFGISEDALIVGTAVRFYPQKGLRYLIQAIPKILESHPKTIFLLVGDGVERQMLEGIAKSSGIEENVVFTGFRQDIPNLIGAMDIYVLPSLWEGLPLALIEALLARKAVVATSVGGNTEVIEDGHTGFLIPPQQPDLIAQRIISLLDSNKLRDEFAENGFLYAKKHFSLKTMIEQYETLYSRIFQKQG
jgi:glycosyltransferase involved in cell wall biosynthesis